MTIFLIIFAVAFVFNAIVGGVALLIGGLAAFHTRHKDSES